MQNNLKQIGLAAHNHHDANNFFPAGRFGCDGSGTPCNGMSLTSVNRGGSSAFVFFLPYIEQDNVYKSLGTTEADVPWPTTDNATWRPFDKVGLETRPSTYVCPSDTAQPYVTNTGQGSSINAAVGSYALVAGTNGPSQGISAAVKFDNTGLVPLLPQEAHGGHGRRHQQHADRRRGVRRPPGQQPERLERRLPPHPLPADDREPDQHAPGTGILYNNANNGAFMSRHSGGANFALGDGSVRFMPQNMDITLYRNLSTIKGGEVASPN